MLATAAVSVRELTAYVKRLFDRDEILCDVTVRGEISNLTRHSSGHVYFSLKDDAAALSCVCFRAAAATLRFDLHEGDRVLASGAVTVYEKQGRYQLIVRTMQPDGAGELAAALEALKAKLEAEGLFDPSRKRPLPRFPRRIALCTSPTGAAVQDMVTILSRRCPMTGIVIIPTVVQGETAPASICESIRLANTRDDIDLIILGRGGGSMEDLWAFNDETVARAIFGSSRPTISAVGHETDFTVADLVADLRAPTPSAAAELAVPDCLALGASVTMSGRRLLSALERRLADAQASFASLAEHPLLKRPEAYVEARAQRVDDAATGLTSNMALRLERLQTRVARAEVSLRALSPRAVLSRGYALVTGADGTLIQSINQVQPSQGILAQVADGLIAATVTDTRATEGGTA
jgi:exodeoxyribonuclease VII large subunit